MNILVTGGTGTLGRAVVPILAGAGHTVRVMTRRPSAGGDVESVGADLATGAGISQAVSGIDVVVHLASAPYRGRYTARVDVAGTGRLLAAARQAGVGHLLFISIVGIDRVPWGYFRRKLAAEQLVRDGGVPWSILRVTQFHSLVDGALRAATRLPALIGDVGIAAQPVDPRDVADRIAARVSAGPSMITEEFGGPEVLHFDHAAAQWLDARRMRRPMLRLRLPGAFGRALRSGYLTTTARPAGKITWQEYLAETAGRAPARRRPGRAAPGSSSTPRRAEGSGARKRTLVIWFERHVQNPPIRAALRSGLPLPMFALLETTGRKTGMPRQNPVINGLDGDQFWIVAEHGRNAHYVRNLEADPRVRVKVGRRWRTAPPRSSTTTMPWPGRGG